MSTEHAKYDLDEYGGWTGIQGEKTGFFHLKEIDGRHWFITPEGNVFFPVALSHLYSGESDRACQNVYGGDKEAWLQDSLAKARTMGFNCALGSPTSPERNLNGFVDIPQVEALFREENFPFAVGVILLKHPWEFVEGEDLPDIFEPSYAAMIEARAEAVCPQAKDDPLVMGYYYGFGAFNHSDYIEAVTEINRTVYTYSPDPATPQAMEMLDKELYDAWDKHLVGETLWAT